MIVDKVILCGADWIGFLGQRKSTTNTASSAGPSNHAVQQNIVHDDSITGVSEDRGPDAQYLEIFSQRNIAICLHTIKAEAGSFITDVAVQGVETLALANEDGSVMVKQLTVAKPGSSFILNDVINQSITSENRQMVIHSNQRIDRVIYFGERLEDYIAVSGATLYSGRDDAEITLKARVSQLQSFKSAQSAQSLLAVGMADRGEV